MEPVTFGTAYVVSDAVDLIISDTIYVISDITYVTGDLAHVISDTTYVISDIITVTGVTWGTEFYLRGHHGNASS